MLADSQSPNNTNKEMTNETQKRRTEITIETHSLTIVKMSSGAPAVYCRHCLQNTAVFPQGQAALIFQVEAAELERLWQTGQIHTNGDSDLCSNSLAVHFGRTIKLIED